MPNSEKRKQRIAELLHNFITANLDAILETVDDSEFEAEVKEVVEANYFDIKVEKIG